MAEISIGIIGGSGLYQIEGIEDIVEKEITTPFGSPSDKIIIGTIEGKKVAFLPRHSRGHKILPHEVNSRANIYALKSLGVKSIFAVSAVGSMKEKIKPLDMVIPDQIFDRTKNRINTFYGRGMAVHIAFANPFCNHLREMYKKACELENINYHFGGTYLCIDGPQFSTLAESNIYRSWGVDVIGMTAIPECKLAREAEICYSILALVTDYDCWHAETDIVTADMVIQNLIKNAENAKKVLKQIIKNYQDYECSCHNALADSIITKKQDIPDSTKRELNIIAGKYLK